MDLLERIEWVLANRADLVKNPNHWGEVAGCARTQVPQIVDRLKNPKPTRTGKAALGATIQTLFKLADAAPSGAGLAWDRVSRSPR